MRLDGPEAKPKIRSSGQSAEGDFGEMVRLDGPEAKPKIRSSGQSAEGDFGEMARLDEGAYWRNDEVPRVNVLVVDNYDSFTFNLVQYLGELGAECEVVRNDAITVDAIEASLPDRILLSPGPCTPDEAGISLEVIRRIGPLRPILGVCLGHQAIGQAYGGKVVRARRLMHGKVSPISHDGGGIFRGLPDPMVATRYHSLVVERESLPSVLEVTAWTDDGGEQPTIMAVRHRSLDVVGVQFHPESILTADGKRLLSNWLERP